MPATHSKRMPLWNTCLGNLFEHYDTALFGFLSPFLAPLIFPKQNPITALMLTYAIIPLGMLMRPLGSLVFGVIGDTYGRQYALFLTLSGMSLVSGSIALTPTYSQIGLLAPCLFFLGRLCQNFFAAGETIGGAIFLLENSSKQHHDILSGLYSISTLAGHLLASWGVFLIGYYHVVETGWRFLYLFGCLTACFGCMMRYTSFCEQKPQTKPLMHLTIKLWQHKKALFYIAVCSGFASASYSITLVLMNGFIPMISSFTKADVMKINGFLLLFDMAALAFFGWLASRIPREKLMLLAAMGVIFLSIPLFLKLENASWMTMIMIRTLLVVFGVAFFAPFHAWANELVPPEARYTVISLGYALGSQLLGSPTAALALWSFQKTSMIASLAWYWMFLALASSIVITIASHTKKLHLETTV